MKVSVRELKDRLSEHLRAVQGGQAIVVTSHNKPVARLSPVPAQSASGVQRMIDEGLATWDGKKPRVTRRRPVKLRGAGDTVADMVLNDRA